MYGYIQTNIGDRKIMKIQKSQITKLTITDIPQLDSIALYLEDYKIGQGKITITCFNESWSYYWGSMGDRTLAEFIVDCDNHYLSQKLNPSIEADIIDEDGMDDFAKKEVIRRRREGSLDKKEARDIYDRCHDLYEMKAYDSQEYACIMYRAFGDDWWEFYPTKPNPKYQYFCRILDAVKEALRQIQKDAMDALEDDMSTEMMAKVTANKE